MKFPLISYSTTRDLCIFAFSNILLLLFFSYFPIAPGGEAGCDISQIPCRVCSGPSSGFHFGALTCEGCKGFFRRTVLSNVRLECLGNNDCPITPANRNMCKSCRFQRCLAVGMSKTGSRIGRQPNAIKYYCAREISQLTNSSDGEAMANPSTSSSNQQHETTRRNSISHSSTSSGNTTLSSNINNNANSTTHYDNNNNNNNEHDLSLIGEERCKSAISQSNYPTSSWPSAKRILSNSDHMDSVSTTVSTIASSAGTSVVSSSIPRTIPATTNPFTGRNSQHSELQGNNATLKNGSVPCSSPSSSSSPPSGLKHHIKYKQETRTHYPNPQSRLHHTQPSPSQNSCCSNSSISSTSSTNNGVVLLSGPCNPVVQTSSCSANGGGGDYLFNDCPGNIVKRRKTISSVMDIGSEIADSKITSSKLTPLSSTYMHDDDDDIDSDGGCNTIGVCDREHSDHRYRHRHHHPHHYQRHNTEVANSNDEHIYSVINSSGVTADSSSSSSNYASGTGGRYEKVSDVKTHNISMDNFPFIDQSRHLLSQIKLPSDNIHTISSSNNSTDRGNIQQLQFRSCSLVDRSSPLTETPLNDPHAVSTHLSQPYVRPTQLCLSTARNVPEESSYSLSYLSSSSSSTTSCPRSSVISDYSDLNHPTSTADNGNNNISDQIWLPKHRYFKSNRGLPTEHTIQPIIPNNNNCLDPNSLGFLNGRVDDSNILSESEPTSTTTPWFAAAAAAVAVVMAASQSPSTNPALDPYTVSCNLNERFALTDNMSLNQTDIHNSRRIPVSATNFSKNIRNNLLHPVRRMLMSDRVEDIWNQMMKHFETHSRFIVQFVKYIPGGCIAILLLK
ncbi:unnamed protein product [Heterobilharzia americana]|nr:unnamed protein product [Heterobilharzia americana]